MSKEDMLRHANNNKPVDFAAEFKAHVDVEVAKRLASQTKAPAAAPEGGGEE